MREEICNVFLIWFDFTLATHHPTSKQFPKAPAAELACGGQVFVLLCDLKLVLASSFVAHVPFRKKQRF